MEGVIQALNRKSSAPQGRDVSDVRRGGLADLAPPYLPTPKTALELNRWELIANRITAFDGNHPLTRSYDVLRNVVSDDLAGVTSPSIAVTSPTAGCGVTLTAANLALSIARQQRTRVMLFDCNPSAAVIPKPFGQFVLRDGAQRENLEFEVQACIVEGVEIYVGSVAYEKRALTRAALENYIVAPLSQLKKLHGPMTVVLDLPPMLKDDQTLPLVLGADLVLLVAAVGVSTVEELQTCKTFLSSTQRLQITLNKARKHGL